MEFYSPLEYLILFAAGIITGIVNTLAGSGTIFSVGTMLFFGIPLEIANTTNRLGVLFQNISGLLSIRKYGQFERLKTPFVAFFSTLIGAIIGAYLAVHIAIQWLESIALLVIILMIFYTFFTIRRSSLLRQLKFKGNKLTHMMVFFIIGCYGGFIQIGVGIVLLFALKSIYKLDWVAANYLKLVIILAYTIPTLLFFGFSGMVLWITGGILAVGQVLGAYLAGWGISINKKIAQAIPYIILLMLIVTGMKLLFG